MSILGDIGGFLSDNAKWLLPTAAIGAGVYTTLRAQKARERQAKAYQDAQNRQFESEMAAFEAPMAAPMVVPALSAKAAKKASALYKDYYQRSLDVLNPYVQTGLRQLPKQEALFDQGTAGLSELAKVMLSPQSIVNTNQETPAYRVPVKIPDYLKGGA